MLTPEQISSVRKQIGLSSDTDTSSTQNTARRRILAKTFDEQKIVGEQNKKNWLQQMGSSILRPFVRAGVSASAVGKGIGSVMEGQGADLGQPQTVKLPFGLDVTTTPYGFDEKGQRLSPDKFLAQTLGEGTELASYFIGGSGVVKGSAEALKAKLLQAMKTGAEAGLAGGGLFSGGQALQEDKNLPETLVDTAIGATAGAIGGAAFPVAARVFGDVTKNIVKIPNEALVKGGQALQGLAEKAITMSVPEKESTKIALQAYNASKPGIWDRVVGLFGQEVQPKGNLKKPITSANTILRNLMMGTEQQLGVQARKISSKIWGVIDSTLSSVHYATEKINFKGFLGDIQKFIIKETPDLSRRESLLKAFNAIAEDYKMVSNVSWRKLQSYKEGWAKFVPEKAYKGEPIAGAVNEVRDMMADYARQMIYGRFDDVKIKQMYLDYGNLKNIAEMGIKAQDPLRSKSAFKQAWEAIMDLGVTPVTTIGGQIVYRIGQGMEFIGAKGATTLRDIFVSGTEKAGQTINKAVNNQEGFTRLPGTVPKDEGLATQTAFQGFKDLTTKVLERLKGKSVTSRQEILDFTNMPELKQAERDIIRNVLDSYGGEVSPLIQDAKQAISKGISKEEWIKGRYSFEDNPKIAQAFDEIQLGGKVEWKFTEGVFGSKIQPFAGQVKLPDGTTKFITKQSEVLDLAKQYGKPIGSLFEQKPDIVSKLIDARDNAKFDFKLSADKTQIEVNANGIKFKIPRGDARMADVQQIKVRQYLNALIEKKQSTRSQLSSLYDNALKGGKTLSAQEAVAKGISKEEWIKGERQIPFSQSFSMTDKLTRGTEDLFKPSKTSIFHGTDPLNITKILDSGELSPKISKFDTARRSVVSLTKNANIAETQGGSIVFEIPKNKVKTFQAPEGVIKGEKTSGFEVRSSQPIKLNDIERAIIYIKKGENLNTPIKDVVQIDRFGNTKVVDVDTYAGIKKKLEDAGIKVWVRDENLTPSQLSSLYDEAVRGDKIPVQDFANKVKAELLPLKVKNSDVYKSGRVGISGEAMLQEGNFTPKYENISLPKELKGNVANYKENIYESPIATSAGDTHFNYQSKNYFGHTRIEDMADNQTRRVIEVQSDLYQKGNLEGEVAFANIKDGLAEAKSRGFTGAEAQKMAEGWAKDAKALQQYNDPTAHFRMIREEVKQAAIDGKTKLQFPTGETIMKIEGLGENADNWLMLDKGNQRLRTGDLKVGGKIARVGTQDNWIITDVLGDGKFKAVPKALNDKLVSKGLVPDNIEKETFDISGKVDTSNAQYRRYEKTIGSFLKNKYGAKLVTDKQGVTWWEVLIKKEFGKNPIEALGIGLGLGASTMPFMNQNEP